LDYFPAYFPILAEYIIRYELGYFAARERKLSEEKWGKMNGTKREKRTGE
jgi:hypothetical protein